MLDRPRQSHADGGEVCDAFVISPSSTAALTPAVERACATGVPVVVFDRGVQTDCATTFIHPIGGYAWGIDTAEFLSDHLSEGDKVVALRILTGLAPVYSNFQWRTPLLAVEKIFAGEEVPAEWVLPQEPITDGERSDYLTANDGMPDGHYAKFGGEDLPGFPAVWQDRIIP